MSKTLKAPKVTINCDVCSKEDSVPCPGVPEVCVLETHLCDRVPHCPNLGDEDVWGMCGGNCSQGSFTCHDGSFCVSKDGLCDFYRQYLSPLAIVTPCANFRCKVPLL